MILLKCEVWLYYGDYGDGAWRNSTFIFYLVFINLGMVSRYTYVVFALMRYMAQDSFCAFASCCPKYLAIGEHANGVLWYKISVMYIIFYP